MGIRVIVTIVVAAPLLCPATHTCLRTAGRMSGVRLLCLTLRLTWAMCLWYSMSPSLGVEVACEVSCASRLLHIRRNGVSGGMVILRILMSQ
jgi:hypothetical protein